MLKIALSGCCGRMGHVINDIVSGREGMEIVAGFDINTVQYADFPIFADPFEFTGECDVIYVPTDNTVASNTEIINNICLPAKVPVITGEEGICEGCGVATLSISYYDLGVTTGKMAVKILKDGEDISTMPIEYAPNFTKEYNKDICEELGIEVPDDYVAIGEAAEETAK